MSIEELFDYVSDKKWTFRGGLIRCATGDCPILAAFHKKFPSDVSHRNDNYRDAGALLGMTVDDIRNVVDAADYGYSQFALHDEMMKKLNVHIIV
jgi:hypothetical protein